MIHLNLLNFYGISHHLEKCPSTNHKTTDKAGFFSSDSETPNTLATNYNVSVKQNKTKHLLDLSHKAVCSETRRLSFSRAALWSCAVPLECL